MPVVSPLTTAVSSHCRNTQGEPVRSSAVGAWSSNTIGIPALAAALIVRAARAAAGDVSSAVAPNMLSVPVSITLLQ